MKMTKEQVYFRMGFYSAMYDCPMSEQDCEITWQGYLTLPENASDAQLDELANKLEEDIVSTRGSVKE